MRRRETGLARVRDLDLCWSLVGEPMSPILMTIMGLGVQMTEWDDAFVGEFVRAGFQLLQFDNRDSGLSSKVDEAYTLEDMADDAAGLLDALGIPRVHVFGMSMGGMIGQALAIRHPDRVLSLASVMSTTGAKGVGRTARHVIDAMIGAPPSTGRSAVVAAQRGVSARRGGDEAASCRRVRPRPLPRGQSEAVRGDPSLPGPDRGARCRRSPGCGDPRRPGPGHGRQRGAGDRRRDSRRTVDDPARNGPPRSGRARPDGRGRSAGQRRAGPYCGGQRN